MAQRVFSVRAFPERLHKSWLKVKVKVNSLNFKGYCMPTTLYLTAHQPDQLRLIWQLRTVAKGSKTATIPNSRNFILLRPGLNNQDAILSKILRRFAINSNNCEAFVGPGNAGIYRKRYWLNYWHILMSKGTSSFTSIKR